MSFNTSSDTTVLLKRQNRSSVPKLFCATVLLITILGVVGSALPVFFPDSHLERAVREAIGKETDKLTSSDLDGLIELTAIGQGISNLSGLEHCTSLVLLNLGENYIENLSPLAGLTGLKTLILRSNEIANISSLAGLTDLVTLDLDFNLRFPVVLPQGFLMALLTLAVVL